MKKIFILFSIIPLCMYSQITKITYEEKANIENQLKNVTDPEIRKRVAAHLSKATVYNLIDKKESSIYFNAENSSTKNEGDFSIEDKNKPIEIGKINGGVYKDFKGKMYYNQCNILGKEFLVVDKILPHQWIITKEVKKIGSFDCKKATATINGQNIEAWFTDKIAISNGPAEYDGLPGLIIELKADKKTYTAIKIEPLKSDYAFVKPTKGKVVSQKEYDKTLAETLNDFKSGNGNITIGK